MFKLNNEFMLIETSIFKTDYYKEYTPLKQAFILNVIFNYDKVLKITGNQE